jgi:hypothetical protein
VSKTGLLSLVSVDGSIYAGGMSDAVVLREAGHELTKVTAFDRVPGRATWHPNGPPLHVRSLTATSDNRGLFAAVHVGGIPVSRDGGMTWMPTIPIDFDVHEVKAHPSSSGMVAAATAVGLLVSDDGGETWQTFADGPEEPHALAIAVLRDPVLFSVQDGPCATRSQIWRWRASARKLEQVRDGLPQWLEGKVDTGNMSADGEVCAVVDGGGNLFFSDDGSRQWHRVVSGIKNGFGVWVCVEDGQ